jgi:hypothetical protein
MPNGESKLHCRELACTDNDSTGRMFPPYTSKIKLLLPPGLPDAQAASVSSLSLSAAEKKSYWLRPTLTNSIDIWPVSLQIGECLYTRDQACSQGTAHPVLSCRALYRAMHMLHCFCKAGHRINTATRGFVICDTMPRLSASSVCRLRMQKADPIPVSPVLSTRPQQPLPCGRVPGSADAFQEAALHELWVGQVRS